MAFTAHFLLWENASPFSHIALLPVSPLLSHFVTLSLFFLFFLSQCIWVTGIGKYNFKVPLGMTALPNLKPLDKSGPPGFYHLWLWVFLLICCGGVVVAVCILFSLSRTTWLLVILSYLPNMSTSCLNSYRCSFLGSLGPQGNQQIRIFPMEFLKHIHAYTTVWTSSFQIPMIAYLSHPCIQENYLWRKNSEVENRTLFFSKSLYTLLFLTIFILSLSGTLLDVRIPTAKSWPCRSPSPCFVLYQIITCITHLYRPLDKWWRFIVHEGLPVLQKPHTWLIFQWFERLASPPVSNFWISLLCCIPDPEYWNSLWLSVNEKKIIVQVGK